MHPTRLFTAALAALFFLSACATTPQGRIARDQAYFDSLPSAAQEAIRAGRVEVGFTARMVRLALGDPDSVSQRTTAAGKAEVWSYRDRAPVFSIGIGVGGGSGHFGGGVGAATSTGRDEQVRKRIVLRDGVVEAVEEEAAPSNAS